jgi:hypothetical protein
MSWTGSSTGTPCQNAKLVKRALCECGFPVIQEHVPLGTIYLVHIASLQGGGLSGGCRKFFQVQIIFAEASPYGEAGWIPFDIFELERTT